MEGNTNDNDLLSRWLMEELSPEEKERLGKDETLKELRAVTDDISTWSLPSVDISTGYADLLAKRDQFPREAKVISMTTWMKIAASVALLLVGFYGWDFFFNNEVFIQTGIAQQEEVKLPDGSTIQLDAASSLSYFKKGWKNDRKIRIAGQAFFDVKKGGSFIVITQRGTVSVLGTTFNVRADNEKFIVACYDGKVRAESQGTFELLEAGQGAELRTGQLIRFETNGSAPDWMQGFSSFDQTPLSAVVDDLKKYHKLEINLPERYADLEFTGRFTHEDSAMALRSVFITMEINYTLSPEGKVDFN